MKTRQLERRRRLAAIACSTIGWVGAGLYWLDARLNGYLPWQRADGYPIDLAGLLLLLLIAAGVVAALPDDREDVNERRLWGLVLWCLGPVVALGWLFFYPLAWFQ
ncbi:MAG: hypothetical protein ACKV19_15900 [Verrucomicrobiales bacterium]